MDQYWKVYKEDLELASNFKYLSAVAISVLGDMKKKEKREIVMICGPITTGGLSDKGENERRFRRAIEVAEEKGLFVFNQFHLAEAIDRIVKNTKGLSDGKSCSVFVVEELYYPIFNTGRINKGFFLPGWESSTGAYWENRYLQNLNIPVEDYPEGWLDLLN